MTTTTQTNVVSEKQFADAKKMNDSLGAYFNGIEVDSNLDCFIAVGELMSMTCPYEPETKSGNTQTIPKKYRQHFLATEAVYLDMCCDQSDWKILEEYWNDVAERIRAYDD